MAILPPSGLLRRLPLTFLLLSAAPAAFAQAPYGATVQAFPQSSDPAELLAQALRTLATEPANLTALTAAGHNALTLGDPNAAVGFFGRAQEIAPSNGAVKAGLGSALVQLERPRDALRLFADAARLGVADADIAEDRGLAYDLTGQQSLAQRDYQTVLAARPDDETARRRLALSQGISGNKTAAIATLDPLIRKRDIAGWRAQTFVLAMDGDPAGANAITRVMLPQQSAMLQPFLVRLAELSPADKARAVHFGEMPAGSTPYTPVQVASVDTPATYASAPPPRPYVAPVPRPASVTPPPSLAPASSSQVRVNAPIAAAADRTISAPSKPVQVAAAAPQSRALRRPPGVSVNDRDAIFALGQPYYVRAPLASIALTPAPPPKVQPSPVATTSASIASAPATAVGSTSTPASVIVTSTLPALPQATSMQPAADQPAASPPIQVAQASPPPSDLAGSSALPVPSAEGHYDLPHDAVTKAGAEPLRPAPVKDPALRTVGTPVAHNEGRNAAAPAEHKAPAESSDTAPTSKSRPTPADGEVPLKAHALKGTQAGPTPSVRTARKAEVDEGDKAQSKTAFGAPDDCSTAPSSRRARGRAGKAASKCVTAARLDDSDATVPKKSAAADDDCPPATKTHGRTRSKASAACARVATADDDVPKAGTKKISAEEPNARTGKSSKASKTAADKPAAERIYVQVAGGANKDDLDKAWAGVKKKAPDLMKGRAPSTTPLKATNRLLLGPFKDEDEAQAFVNKMAGKGLSGFTFKSSKGQKVAKVDSGQ